MKKLSTVRQIDKQVVAALAAIFVASVLIGTGLMVAEARLCHYDLVTQEEQRLAPQR